MSFVPTIYQMFHVIRKDTKCYFIRGLSLIILFLSHKNRTAHVVGGVLACKKLNVEIA